MILELALSLKTRVMAMRGIERSKGDYDSSFSLTGVGGQP